MAPTGAMFNRRGELLSIADEFTDALKDHSRSRLVWPDCEALERRHGIGRGSLIVLDVMLPDLTASDRYRLLLEEAQRLGWSTVKIGDKPEPCLSPSAILHERNLAHRQARPAVRLGDYAGA